VRGVGHSKRNIVCDDDDDDGRATMVKYHACSTAAPGLGSAQRLVEREKMVAAAA
jgi:hypothetical protein